MLANGLIFLLGTLVATLVALVLAPVVWRKAQNLARRDFEATIPISANEIRAEFDRVRAEAALTVRRQEVLSGETRAKSAKVQAELGRSIVENAELQSRNRGLVLLSAEKDKDLAGLRTDLGTRDEDVRRLSKELAEVRHEGELTAQELEALARRFRELGEIAEERKIHIVALETKLEVMADTLRASERAGRDAKAAAERLEDEVETLERSLQHERAAAGGLHDKVATLVGRLADREEELLGMRQPESRRRTEAARLEPKVSPPARPAPSAAAPFDRPEFGTSDAGSIEARRVAGMASEGPPRAASPNAGARLRAPLAKPLPAPEILAEEADIRERISDIAARVIRMTALAEGSASPLRPLLDTAGEEDGELSSGPNDRPTLADRVRRLAEAERTEGGGTPSRQSRASGD